MEGLKSSKDIATMNKEEIQTFINSFDTIISDCDGVLWVFGVPIKGSPETANKLISLGKKFILMSNNAIIHIDKYVKICQVLGMPIKEEDIFTPAVGILRYLKSQDMKGKKAFVVGSEALSRYLQENGIQCCDTGVDSIPEEVGAVRAQINGICPDVGAVVLDTDVNLSYLKIMRANLHLKNPDCLFIVGATDRDISISGKDFIPGPGYFVSLIEELSGRTAVVVGKPNTYMTDGILKDRCLDPARVLFIGDSLPQDIGLGKAAGFQTLLVLSGLSKLTDINDTNIPDYYVKTLSDLLPLLPEAKN